LAKPVESWKETISNDFENSLFPSYPTLVSIKEELYNLGAQYAAMSGSGSTLFGIFENATPIPEAWDSYTTWSGFLP